MRRIINASVTRGNPRVTTAALCACASIAVTVPAAHADARPQAGAQAQAAAQYPVGNVLTAVSNFVLSPDAVAGANNWSCKPSPQHPTPVILVPATFADLGMNWVALSPTLADAGYCVYSFNYGMNSYSLGRIGGLTDIGASAQTLSAFVDQVLAATGASQVDLVGHSQGGMMPNYYLKRLGGAAKVRRFVALAPSNHGTTLDGLVSLAGAFNLLGLTDDFLGDIQMPGLVEQEQGSAFQTALWADGDTVAGPQYFVIETDHDEVVTPYTNAFLNGPDVENTLIQNQCPADPVGHVGMFDDSPAIQDVLNDLGPDDPDFQPTCTGYGLPF